MTYLIACPVCHQEGLDPRYSPSTCAHCKAEFQIIGFCPKCHQELLKMQCCSIDFFCNHCNELVSKRKIEFHLAQISTSVEGAESNK